MALTSVNEVFEKMPLVFNAAAAAGVNMVFQFNITGSEAGDWYVVIKDGTCQVSKGVHDSPPPRSPWPTRTGSPCPTAHSTE